MYYKVESNIYLSKYIQVKYIVNLILFSIDTSICITSIILALSLIVNEPVVCAFFFSLIIPFGLLAYLRLRKFLYISCAIFYSKIFFNSSKPFIEIKILTIEKPPIIFNSSVESVLRKIEGAIKKGYLVNCTVEIQNGIPVIALAKKVAKDICPYCGAPIVEVVNNNYVCKYCRREIANVIKKK